MRTDPKLSDLSNAPLGQGAAAVRDFLRDLVRSRVLDESRADQLFAEVPPRQKWEPAAFAEFLVTRSEVTRFQADKLLRGHWQGLALGPYVLLCPLGRGGMGVVYLGRKFESAELVALKVLPPRRAKDEPRMLTRFLREIEIGLRLPKHANLTRTLDAGEWAGINYLAMEFVTGKTVREHVLESGPMSVGEAARIFAGAAFGLDAAHEAGFVHRDIKPANIIVEETGGAKVLDFGFSLIRGESASADPSILGGQGYTLGTMDFLPPEQAANAATVGPAADLYALGCSLYFAVTGSPPFPGGTAQDKIRWHRTDTPDSVMDFNPILPAEFARIIAWLMAKKPAARPKSGEEVARRLLAWADPLKPSPPPSPPAAVLKQVEARWKELSAATGAIAEEESLIIEDETATARPLPVAMPVGMKRSIAWPVQVPKWVFAIVVGCIGIVILSTLFIGWVIAQLVAG